MDYLKSLEAFSTDTIERQQKYVANDLFTFPVNASFQPDASNLIPVPLYFIIGFFHVEQIYSQLSNLQCVCGEKSLYKVLDPKFNNSYSSGFTMVNSLQIIITFRLFYCIKWLQVC